MSLSEKDLDQAIEKFFEKYDKDKNGFLDKN